MSYSPLRLIHEIERRLIAHDWFPESVSAERYTIKRGSGNLQSWVRYRASFLDVIDIEYGQDLSDIFSKVLWKHHRRQTIYKAQFVNRKGITFWRTLSSSQDFYVARRETQLFFETIEERETSADYKETGIFMFVVETQEPMKAERKHLKKKRAAIRKKKRKERKKKDAAKRKHSQGRRSV